jgi:hypothetical protein
MPEYIKLCSVCDRKFVTRYKNQKTCSRKCNNSNSGNIRTGLFAKQLKIMVNKECKDCIYSGEKDYCNNEYRYVKTIDLKACIFFNIHNQKVNL